MEIKREDVIAYSYYDEKGRLIAIIDREKYYKNLKIVPRKVKKEDFNE